MAHHAPAREYAISVRNVESIIVLTKRLTVGMPELGATMGSTFGELYEHLARLAVPPAGPPFVLYHARIEDGDRWDVELCAPIAYSAVAPAGYECRTLPEARVVTALHRGPYEDLTAAYDSVARWATDNGLVLGGPPRETYLSEPGTPPEETETIIDWPLAEAHG